MRRRRPGFTIVELLIVIVVIGVLAAITIVAYNGFQTRAKNAQTAQAMSGWVKAMKLYKADNGRWPPYGTCLGSGYTYGVSGTATTGTAQCRQNDSGGFVENTIFKTAMAPYIGTNLPTPAFVTARLNDTNWRRGISYLYGGGGDGTMVYMEVAYAGLIGTCPVVDGFSAAAENWNGNTYCFYLLGSTADT